MPTENFLAIIHGLDYLAILLLFGVQFFDLFIGRLSARSSSKYFLIATITSLSFLLLSSADMAGAWNLSRIWLVMGGTSFGFYGCLRVFVLVSGFVLSVGFGFKSGVRLILLVLAGLALFFSSLTSHAAMSETNTYFRILLDFIHSSAASVWVGGLFALYFYLGNCNEPFLVVKRFSHFAMAGTGLILLTGLFQLYFTFKTPSDLWSTTYGGLALAKLVLFFFALAAASLNHFLHLRNWRVGNDLIFSKNIKREVTIEMFLLFILIGVTGFLTRSNLPGE